MRHASILFAGVVTALLGAVAGRAAATHQVVAEGTTVTFPADVAVAPSTEPHRAASAAAWEIESWPEVAEFQLPGDPQVGEVFFHTSSSIERFDAACRRKTGRIDDDSCFEGWRPHLDDLRRERLALARRDVARLCPAAQACHLAALAGLHWIVRTSHVNWGDEVRYVTYLGHVRLSVVFDLAGIDAADRAALDHRRGILDDAVDDLAIRSAKK